MDADDWRYRFIQRFQNNNGFTLIEVLAALFLLGILTAIFSLGLVAAVQSYDFSRTNVDIAQKAQLAMTRMVRELSELTHIHAVSSAGNDTFIIYERLIEGAAPPAVRFGIHHDSAQGVVLLYTNLNAGTNSLGGSTVSEGDLLIDGVHNLDLDYFSGSTPWILDSGTDNIQQLSTIRLSLALTRPDSPGQPQNFETRIHLRNNNNFGGAAPNTPPASRGDYDCFIDTLLGGLGP